MLQCHLEIACFNVESTREAVEGGASRIELCANSEVGGTTPNVTGDSLLDLKKQLGVPIFVMIRPRGGSFCYSEDEFSLMRSDITRLREAADGFVFGVLEANGEVDMTSNQLLILEAKGKPCTMHRAFDETPDLMDALSKVIECGFSILLTSGGASIAAEGITNLKNLVQAASDRIIVMPGGGIRRHNIQEIKASTGAKWFHSAAIVEGSIADAEEVEALRKQVETDQGFGSFSGL